LQGFVGSLFREFGVTVAAAVLISALVSLTITPVLNVLLQRKNAGHGKFYEKTEPFFKGMESGYRRMLTGFVRIRWVAWILIAVCGTLIYFLYNNLQTELAPLEDKSSIRFQITGPEGASYGYMLDVGDKLSNYLIDSVPQRDFAFAAIPGFNGTGVNNGFARLKLVDPEFRNKSQSEIAKEITKKLPRFNQARIFPVEEQTISVGLGSKGAQPIQFILSKLRLC